MKHLLKLLLFSVSIVMLAGCGAQNNQTVNTTPVKDTKKVNSGNVLKQNVPENLVILERPIRLDLYKRCG